MNRYLADFVRLRAGDLCEYCRLPQAYVRQRLHVEHIRAKQHGGPTVPANLALACQQCNLSKGPNATGFDPDTDAVVRLFHPRRQNWSRHFHWDGAILVGRTPAGRATVAVLAINEPNRVVRRMALIAAGVFPPAD